MLPRFKHVWSMTWMVRQEIWHVLFHQRRTFVSTNTTCCLLPLHRLLLVTLTSHSPGSLLLGTIMPNVHSSVFKTLTADTFTVEVSRRESNATAVYVRLTGPHSSVHLNSQKGVLEGQHPNNLERFAVCLYGTKISARPRAIQRQVLILLT